ncbi:MAG: nucleotide sugar epimerase [Ignavibacteria bacterium GWB2_35_12]|nr:MAG: nucleotide sugar epimerase [Ignavibacteria bacterium GWA2_35_8]OGU42454.1 MAG: nucleotide sugar epimerase [Ignavibacteria bacterium GWB2_35_12]OGU96623.1 MAG: nucleotide sugar epimerase [Ignavibacteria bacterium RIFOXYA2_FULL_35_10]OGV24234.1 MAG: nucleotide sugar epimerase [Ignavibacteria bacterium RIFOXYC2_FULL_35_21]
MQTILLTGSAGFIGSKTAELLLKQGNMVVGIDNFNDYYDIELKKYRNNQLLKFYKYKLELADIEDLQTLKVIFGKYKFDAVINLAARAGVRYSLENPHVYVTTNIHGSLNLLELMREFNIKKYVIASSSSTYAGEEMPFNEELPVNKPISTYAATKKSAELIAYTYHYLFGIDVSILRYFTVYGPAGRPDMSYFRFIKWIDEGKPIELFGDGTQSRDFTYIDDIANGTIKAIKEVGYEIINLGGGKNPISIKYMISKIEEYLGKKALINQKEFQKTDMDVTWADISKAKCILDWEPKVNFDDGLKRTVEWYLENKSWLKEIKI